MIRARISKKAAVFLLLCSLTFISCTPSLVNVVDEGASAMPSLATPNSSGEAMEDQTVMLKSIPEMKVSHGRFEKRIIVPEEALSNKITGSTVIEFRINEDGSTSDHKVIEKLGSGFDEAVITALKETKFEPGQMLNGEKVAFIWRIEVALDTQN